MSASARLCRQAKPPQRAFRYHWAPQPACGDRSVYRRCWNTAAPRHSHLGPYSECRGPHPGNISVNHKKRSRPWNTAWIGWRIKKWDVQWWALHQKPSKKDRLQRDPDDNERGRKKTTTFHPHQNCGRRRGTQGPYYPFGSHPGPMDGEGYNLGTNKEMFDAELYAIYRAAIRLGKRREHDQEYTIFVDSQAAIKCV